MVCVCKTLESRPLCANCTAELFRQQLCNCIAVPGWLTNKQHPSLVVTMQQRQLWRRRKQVLAFMQQLLLLQCDNLRGMCLLLLQVGDMLMLQGS